MHRRAVPLRNECLPSAASAAALARRSRLSTSPPTMSGLTESVTAHAVSWHRDQSSGVCPLTRSSLQRDQSSGVVAAHAVRIAVNKI